MVSRDAYTSKNIVPWSIKFGVSELEPEEILDKALAGKILSDVFFLKEDEDVLVNNYGRRTKQTYIGTQCIFFDFDDASCDIDEFVTRLQIKPTFGYTTLSDGKVEGEKVWHKFRLAYVLSDFVYGLENRDKIARDISKANNFFPTFVNGKKVEGEQDKSDKACSNVQWFFGTNDKARTIFFPENIIQVYPEVKGFSKSYDEYLELREKSEKNFADQKRKIDGDKHFWDDGVMSCIYRDVLAGKGWIEYDKAEGLDRMPYFDVTIQGKMMSLKVARKDDNGNILKDDKGNIIYETRLKKNRRTNKLEEGCRYKCQVVKITNGNHRRTKIYVSCQKIKENYLKLREKYPATPELTPTILFYFLHSYANTYFDLACPTDTISSDELANIVLNVFEDDRDASFFNTSQRTKKRASYCPGSHRFPWDATKRQISAAISAQFRLEDILSHYDWISTPEENINRLNGAKNGKMYAGRKLSEASLIRYFKDVRKALSGNGIYTNKAGMVIYDFNKFNSISKDIIDSFLSYFDFSFSSFFKVSRNTGNTVKRGEKRRMVMEALEGVEKMSVRKTQAFLKERGIEVSVGLLTQILKVSPVHYLSHSATYILTIDNISCSHNENEHPDTLKLLTEGKTIEEISKILNISKITIKRYIKKAKDEGILTNTGSKKYPKWVITKMNGDTLRNEDSEHPDTLKNNENGHPVPLRNKETNNDIMIIDGDTYTPVFEYSDEEYINDMMPGMAASHYGDIDDIPEEDMGEPYITFSIQPTPMIAPKSNPKPEPKTSQMDRYRNMESSGMDSKEIEGLRERLSRLIA